MFSEELDELIEMALADGQLSEKEKRILFRRARSEGVDLDEFEMLLDARLGKAKSKVASSSIYGEARKCPSCGANIMELQGRCPYCGTTFEGVQANSAMERLAEAIERATRECKERYAKVAVEMEQAKARSTRKTRIWDINEVDDDTDEVVAGIIKNFPVPNTKADLMEFILALKPKTQGGVSDVIKDAYYAKYKECLDKAQYMFPDDHEIKRLLEANQLKGLKKISPSGRMIVYCLLGIAGLILFCLVMSVLFPD